MDGQRVAVSRLQQVGWWVVVWLVMMAGDGSRGDDGGVAVMGVGSG